MKKTSAYFISLIIFSALPGNLFSQDTLYFPLRISIGTDIYGPGFYFADNNNLTIEGFLSVDRDTVRSWTNDIGYCSYSFRQYNYSYNCKGFFIRPGIEFNIISPFVSRGKYFAGGAIRYGLSLYSHETPFFESENYWGSTAGTIVKTTHLAHFIEVSPGIRTELFSNVSIGWSIRLRLLIYSGTGKDLRPVYIPGYGYGTKSFSPGINYYIVWSIPYRTLTLTNRKR